MFTPLIKITLLPKKLDLCSIVSSLVGAYSTSSIASCKDTIFISNLQLYVSV